VSITRISNVVKQHAMALNPNWQGMRISPFFVKGILYCSCDGVSLPFPTWLTLDSLPVQRTRYTGRSHEQTGFNIGAVGLNYLEPLHSLHTILDLQGSRFSPDFRQMSQNLTLSSGGGSHNATMGS